MNILNFKSLAKIATFSALIMTLSSAQAELVNNGSLTGQIGNNQLPPGWFAGSTNALSINSPDTMNQLNNVGKTNLLSFGATPSPSLDGGTWVGIGANASLVNENFGQVISNFIIGEEYELSWYDANFGYARRGYTNSNQFVASLNGINEQFTFTGTVRPLAEGWALQTFSFIPTEKQYTLSFRLATAAKSYLSIDGISIDFSDVDHVAAVPEPETYGMMLLGLAMLGYSARRRKSSI